MSILKSKTTHNLLTEINAFKSSKESIVGKLEGSIERNREVVEDGPVLGIGYRQKVFIKRNRSIDLLEKKMNQRIEADKRG